MARCAATQEQLGFSFRLAPAAPRVAPPMLPARAGPRGAAVVWHLRQLPIPFTPGRRRSRWDGALAEAMEHALRWARRQRLDSEGERLAVEHLLELTRPEIRRMAQAKWSATDRSLSVDDLANAAELELLSLHAWRRFAPGAAGPGRTLWPAYACKLARQAMARALQETAPIKVTRHARRKRKRALLAQAQGAAQEVRYRQLVQGEWVERVALAPERAPAAAVPRSLEEELAAGGQGAAGALLLAQQGLRAVPLEDAAHLTDGSWEGREEHEEQASALEALRQLPRPMRVAVAGPLGLLRGGEVVGDSTLAAMLGAPVAQVRTLRAEGLARLRAAMEGAPCR